MPACCGTSPIRRTRRLRCPLRQGRLTTGSETMLENLEQFSGTENYYRFTFDSDVLLTDGAKYVADNASAYWLMEAIASYQPVLRRHQDQRLSDLQFWTLKVNDD